jgi:hypothetical protein
VVVPRIVVDEVVVRGAGLPGADAVANATWLKVEDVTPDPDLLVVLDPGEATVNGDIAVLKADGIWRVPSTGPRSPTKVIEAQGLAALLGPVVDHPNTLIAVTNSGSPLIVLADLDAKTLTSAPNEARTDDAKTLRRRRQPSLPRRSGTAISSSTGLRIHRTCARAAPSSFNLSRAGASLVPTARRGHRAGRKTTSNGSTLRTTVTRSST